MYTPTTRVLTVLELLQSRASMTGTELANRLEVDVRTVRRYIGMLEELGIPVTADRGRGGGYRLMPGFRLPPLMLNSDEALAITLGLLAARRLGIAARPSEVESALAKVNRVLPIDIRSKVQAVEDAVVWDFSGSGQSTVDSAIVIALSEASRECKRVRFQYRRPEGQDSERAFDPYGLACRNGRWYATGYCHLRNDLRLFRIDRMASLIALEESFERPKNFDVLAAVLESLGSVPRTHKVEVWLDTCLEIAQYCVTAEVAMIEEAPGGGILLRGYTDNVDRMAGLIARMGCRFEIRSPDELRFAFSKLAANLLLWAKG